VPSSYTSSTGGADFLPKKLPCPYKRDKSIVK
jgi:hypothetical protein